MKYILVQVLSQSRGRSHECWANRHIVENIGGLGLLFQQRYSLAIGTRRPMYAIGLNSVYDIYWRVAEVQVQTERSQLLLIVVLIMALSADKFCAYYYNTTSTPNVDHKFCGSQVYYQPTEAGVLNGMPRRE
jgi:hypothetical protein